MDTMENWLDKGNFKKFLRRNSFGKKYIHALGHFSLYSKAKVRLSL